MTQLTQQFVQHELSAAFPAMPTKELDALVDDIRANGQREPGVIFEGKVLDGWHRYLACERAGVKFAHSLFPADGDPVAFVKSRNLHRRHLTDSQRAQAVVACSQWAPSGKPAPGAGFATTAKMAKEADVSERTIHHAKVAQSAGLGDVVREGKISAKRAAEIATTAPRVAKKIAETGELPRILPRRDTPAKPLEKPEVDPLKKAREFAKKQNATIRKLRADLAERDAKIEALAGELDAARDNARELADSLEALTKSGEGDAEVAKEIKKLTAQIRVLESQRDQHMTRANEAIAEVKRLKRAAERAK